MTPRQCVDFLLDFYPRKLRPNAATFYAEIFEAWDVELRIDVVKACLENYERWPMVKQLRELGRLRAHLREQRKRGERGGIWGSEFHKANPVHAREAFELIDRFSVPPGVPREERVRLMRAMHERWPARGWDVAADACEQGTEAEEDVTKRWSEHVPERSYYPGPVG